MAPKKNAGKQGKQKAGEAKKGAGGGAGGKKKGGEMKVVKEIKARHILNEKQSKIMECYEKLTESGKKILPSDFAKLATEYSTCSSKNKGGELGWFGRGKMVRAFEDVAFATEQGEVSYPFKSPHGYHIVLVEGRRN